LASSNFLFFSAMPSFFFSIFYFFLLFLFVDGSSSYANLEHVNVVALDVIDVVASSYLIFPSS